MGIFTPSYLKEGPGVSKDARKKKGAFLLIDVMFRKFFRLMQANFLYFVVSLPYLAILFIFVSLFVINGLGLNLNVGAAAGFDAETMYGLAEVFARTVITIGLFNFMGSGPASAAYAYVCRCYTRGEHTWILSDGKDKIVENFLQSIILVVIDVVAICLIMNAIAFYGALTASNTMFGIVRYVTIFLLMLYITMHYYIYQIMVTYKCSFKDLIKYSIIITFAKLPLTVILTVICGGLYYLAMTYIAAANPFMFALFYAIVGLTLMRFPIEFFAARVIEKNIKAEQKRIKRDEEKEEE
ncbi:MAG: hypothetical protein IJH94_07740, partial [Clostridia bacterium]|nr:hypothetical protein [Clostridia bacterium]